MESPQPRPPPQPVALSDDLLEEIFLRVTSPADLGRASIACVSFRRVITDATFLRRYRSVHPPLLLGFLADCFSIAIPNALAARGRASAAGFGFIPAEAPDPNAPAARAFASAADFTFRYVPRGLSSRGSSWHPCDVREGRVLLKSSLALEYCQGFFPDLAVCDPLSRQYLLLPHIPKDLLSSSQLQRNKTHYFESAFLPSGDDEDETSFRVVATSQCAAKSMVFVFYSGSGLWNFCTSTSWDALSLNIVRGRMLRCPFYAYGCYYWKLMSRNRLLKLDMKRMECSTVGLPPDHNERDVVIMEAGEGWLGMFSHNKYVASAYMYYAILQAEGENANECLTETLIPLPCQCICSIVGAAEGYIFLTGFAKDGTSGQVCLSLDMKTLKTESVNIFCHNSHRGNPYFGFPPFMSPRRI